MVSHSLTTVNDYGVVKGHDQNTSRTTLRRKDTLHTCGQSEEDDEDDGGALGGDVPVEIAARLACILLNCVDAAGSDC